MYNENLLKNKIKEKENEIVRFIQELIKIPSTSGKTKEIQDFICKKLKEIGLETDIIKVDPKNLEKHRAFCDDGYPYEERFCTVGTLRGKENKKSIMLNGHIDVVAPGNIEFWKHNPFGGEIVDGRIFGRGSTDMKSGLAAAIFAVEILKELGCEEHGDIIINSVCGEETGGCGALSSIIEGYKADGCVILEPTSFNICHIQAGASSFRLKIKGKSAHACLKVEGVNPINKFLKIYQAIEELDKERHDNYNNSYYKYKENVAPISVGILKCGDWPSTVPDELIAEGRLGIFPNESLEEAQEALISTVKKACEGDKWLEENPPIIEWFEGQFESCEVEEKSDLINVLKIAHKETFKQDAELEGVTYGSDMRLFNLYGNTPAVLYGPGNISIAHTIDEYIEIKDILKAVEVIVKILINWNKTTK